MRIFRYWVRDFRKETNQGKTIEGWVFGGSNVSEQDAISDLNERWKSVCRRVFEGISRESCTYEADIREEIVQTVDEHTVITRNRYGAEILNCSSPVIVDIDDVAPSFWRRIFGGGANNETERIGRIVTRVREAVEKNKHGIRGARLYRTPAGVRAILACAETDPNSAYVKTVMNALHADPLYHHLCRKQNCFRARLTPKPHRIGLKSLHQSWPVDESKSRERATWVAGYRSVAAGYAACSFIEAIGETQSSPTIALHDRWSGALTERRIA
jgi:hypothetical protein